MSLKNKIVQSERIITDKITIVCFMFVMIFSFGCINEIRVTLPSKKTDGFNPTISNVEVINNQVIITGNNLDKVSGFDIKEGATVNNLVIESKTVHRIIANTTASVVFSAGKILDFVFSNAQAASTFTVNFSLCDSTLGGKAFNCGLVPTSGQVLAWDDFTGKWQPKTIYGVNYVGTWDPTTNALPANRSLTVSGDYFIVSEAGTVGAVNYAAGDWIVWNHTLQVFEKVETSVLIGSGTPAHAEGDYDLTDLGDVVITTPTNGQILKFNGTTWVNTAAPTITETDPNVQAFAKSALPACTGAQVLGVSAGAFACVTPAGGGSTNLTTPNKVVVTDASGDIAVATASTTEVNYLVGVTSLIQTQLDAKAASSSIVDWSAYGVAPTIDPSRLSLLVANASKAVVTDASGMIVASATTAAQIGYLSTLTSDVQTQLTAKQATLTGASTIPGSKMRVYNAAGTFYTEITSATTSNRNFILPDANGASGNVLSTDGAGTLSWVAPSASGITNVNGKTTSTVTLTTSDIAEGTNEYHTSAKVRAVTLTGLSTATSTDVVAGDTFLVAVGKLQAKASAVMSSVIGTITTSNTVIAASDTLIAALGKLQGQVNALITSDGNKLSKTGGDTLAGPLTVSGITADIIVRTTPMLGTSVVNQDYVTSAITTATGAITSSQWTTSSANVYFTNIAAGYVGIGTNSPASKLEVKNGSITTAYSAITTRAVDFSTANVISTNAAAGTVAFTNMKDGTSYTLIIQNTGSYVLDGSAGTVGISSWRCAPACASNTISNSSGHVLITMLKAGTVGYVSYISDM
ncbi:hypothetical protein SHI21_14065 [Bacteriovorax sp. PP10]|uniref:IPT/TIG domain-containing protein n=1 Tax=Bacteriovorax antarcticus TaxID=3088717 RepID=A0ABU5VXL1_9BACT|nr:hypothetical protein [Bacteriovorax sp. PP10]MEA9357347.1 hypothetical protein [Bacteriovorax sp. PP10]